MIKLEFISPSDLTGQDIYWLQRGCKDAIDGAQPLDQVQSAIDGRSGIYRIVGEAEGIVVLSMRTKKNLEITCLAGKRLFRHFHAVHEAILQVAAGAGATSVCGYVPRAGLAMMYKKHTKAKTAEYFIEELFV